MRQQTTIVVIVSFGVQPLKHELYGLHASNLTGNRLFILDFFSRKEGHAREKGNP